MIGMTTWERWKAGLEPRDRDERDRMRELGAASDRTYVTEIGYPEPDSGPLQVLRSPKKVTS